MHRRMSVGKVELDLVKGRAVHFQHPENDVTDLFTTYASTCEHFAQHSRATLGWRNALQTAAELSDRRSHAAHYHDFVIYMYS